MSLIVWKLILFLFPYNLLYPFYTDNLCDVYLLFSDLIAELLSEMENTEIKKVIDNLEHGKDESRGDIDGRKWLICVFKTKIAKNSP